MDGEHLRTLARVAPVGLFEADRLGCYTYVNVCWCELTDLTPVEALGDGWKQAIHQEDREYVISAWRRLIDAEVPFSLAFRLRKPGGAARWVQATATTIRDGAGRVDGLAGALTDVTERKETEERLRILARAAEQASDRVAHLQAVTAALSGALSVGEVADVILGQGVAALGARAGTVALLSESGQEVEVIRVAGYAAEVVEESRRFPIAASGSMAEAIRTGEPIWLERSAGAAAHFPILGQYHDIDGSGALAAVPLLVHGRAIGGLGLIFPDERTFSEQDRAFALTLAAECAQAIERARLHEAESRAYTAAERQARERAAILAQIADGVVVANPAGRVTFMNHVARSLFDLADEAPTTDVAPESRWLLTADGEPYSPDEEPLARAAVHGDEVHGVESRSATLMAVRSSSKATPCQSWPTTSPARRGPDPARRDGAA